MLCFLSRSRIRKCNHVLSGWKYYFYEFEECEQAAVHWIGFQNNQINNALVRGGPHSDDFCQYIMYKIVSFGQYFCGQFFPFYAHILKILYAYNRQKCQHMEQVRNFEV